MPSQPPPLGYAYRLMGAGHRQHTLDSPVKAYESVPISADAPAPAPAPAPAERTLREQFNDLKKQIKMPITHETYVPSTTDVNLYTNGQHRRATDPITGIESSNSLKLLFGKGTSSNDITELSERDVLIDSLNKQIMNFVETESNGFRNNGDVKLAQDSYTISNKNIKFVSELDGANISVGTLAIAPQEDPNIIFEVNNAIKNNTDIPVWHREVVLEIDNPNPVLNGIIDSSIYSTTLFIYIDVTDAYKPFIKLDKTYSTLGGALGGISTNKPSTSIPSKDKEVIIKLLSAILPRNIIKNKGTEISFGSLSIEDGQFVSSHAPFSYLDDKTSYGDDNESNPAVVCFPYINSSMGDNPHYRNYSSANLLKNPMPVTCIISKDGDVASQNTLMHSKNEPSNVICYSFLGRGLALETSDVYDSNFDFLSDDEIRTNYYTRVAEAWGTEKINDTTVVSLFTSDRYLDFTNIEGVSYIQNEIDLTKYPNASGIKTTKDNPPEYKPPNNKPSPSRPIEQITIDGPDYKIDGYNVTWLGWSFNVGFNITMGIELYGISFTPPPTEAVPNPEPIQYFYNVNIPHVSTIYTSIDGNDATNFDDTGFYLTGKYISHILTGSDCAGLMSKLPVYKTWNQTNSDPNKTSGPGHTYNNTIGNFYPKDNLNISNYKSNSSTNHPRYAYEEMRGWASGICVQEKDAGVVIKHHNAVKRGKFLTISSYFIMNSYCYHFEYSFTEEGSFKVNINASGLPITYNPFSISASNSIEGVDVKSRNHKHIYTVAFECAVNKQINNVYDKIQAVDKNHQGEQGVAIFNEKHPIQTKDQLDKYGNYDHESKRSYYVDSYLEDDYIGSLAVSSPAFSLFKDTPENSPLKLKVGDVYAPLARNVTPLIRSELFHKQFVIGRGAVADKRKTDWSQHYKMTGNLYENGDIIKLFCNISLDHTVINEHMPIQNFIGSYINVAPVNLLKYNPIMLTNYNMSLTATDFMGRMPLTK